MRSNDYADTCSPGLPEGRSGRDWQAGQIDRTQTAGLGFGESQRSQSASNIYIVSGGDTGHGDKRERFTANTTYTPAHNVSIDRPGRVQLPRDEITVRGIRRGAGSAIAKQASNVSRGRGFGNTAGTADSGDGFRHIGARRPGTLETLRHRPGNTFDIPTGLHPVQWGNKQRAPRIFTNLTANYGGNS